MGQSRRDSELVFPYQTHTHLTSLPQSYFLLTSERSWLEQKQRGLPLTNALSQEKVSQGLSWGLNPQPHTCWASTHDSTLFTLWDFLASFICIYLFINGAVDGSQAFMQAS